MITVRMNNPSRVVPKRACDMNYGDTFVINYGGKEVMVVKEYSGRIISYEDPKHLTWDLGCTCEVVRLCNVEVYERPYTA